jgi:hypothetical protein
LTILPTSICRDERLHLLLIRSQRVSVIADGADGGEKVYDAVADRHPAADIIIPPRAIVCHLLAQAGERALRSCVDRRGFKDAGRRQPLAHTFAALREVRFASDTLARSEGGHGPEQQLIQALVECLSQSMIKFPVEDRRLMTSFEELLLTELNRVWSVAIVGCVLEMSDRFIRQCCQAYVGIRPRSILRQLHERLGGGTAAWLPPSASPRSCPSNTIRRVAVAYPVTVSLWRASGSARGAGAAESCLLMSQSSRLGR